MGRTHRSFEARGSLGPESLSVEYMGVDLGARAFVYSPLTRSTGLVSVPSWKLGI
ncbi:hypothetical protein LZ31DRAFT_554133 [Colletotrichum somersetense]|nr:hypothetical protein LZ31DRAFT_554133 [Colletotrichum somersetense]